ncbi:MAG TPA: hypothetical protein VJ020_05605 [Anaerolineales bacterium]|nr:hypothetical protein [Anaerolineales bacterium]
MTNPGPDPNAPPPRGLRAKAQPVGMTLMVLGYLMMFQPFVQILFTYSFIVILIGTLTFIFSNYLPE